MFHITLRMEGTPLTSPRVAAQIEDNVKQLNGSNIQERFQAEIRNPTQNRKLQAEIRKIQG